MDFRTATDRLMDSGITLRDLAEEIGCSRDTIDRARMDPDSGHHRSPPDGWQEAAARIARRRGGDLQELASDLEAEDAAS